MEFCFSYATLFLVYLIWFFFFKFSYVLMSWRHWIFTAWIVYRYGIGQSGIHQMFLSLDWMKDFFSNFEIHCLMFMNHFRSSQIPRKRELNGRYLVSEFCHSWWIHGICYFLALFCLFVCLFVSLHPVRWSPFWHLI